MSALSTLVDWRDRHVSDRQATIILSFFIGLLASVAAWLLHQIIHHIQLLLTAGYTATDANWTFLLYPTLGIALTALFIRHVVRDNISHGITRVLYAISSKNSHLRAHNCWTSVIASAVTIGFGGSVGAEAPIVLTGSAIGSNLGRLFHLEKRSLMVLVGCGAAAAIAGIFKTPIAGLVFTLEVLMVDLTMGSLLPILISCVTATCFSHILMGEDSLFAFTLTDAWVLGRVPAVILLGVFTAMVSLYFMRTMAACENGFARLSEKPWLKLAAGGVVLGSLIFLFPSLYGEGYSAIGVLLGGKGPAQWDTLMEGSPLYGHSELLIVYVALVLATKVFATSATNGGGGCGGTFAPSLFIGAFAGFLFARIWNFYGVGIYLPEKNFTLLGMAGVMAGVMHAPLTGIFLIAELTGGYQLLIPLIIVSVISTLTISPFEPHSIYAVRLARQGKLLTHHTDQSILTLMTLDSLIEREYTSVTPDMTLGRLVHALQDSRSAFLPVLRPDGTLLGEVDMARNRHIIFRTELYGRFTVRQLMTPCPDKIDAAAPMAEAMRKFQATRAAYLPVVDITGHLLGYIDRSRMYTTYRNLVADFSTE